MTGTTRECPYVSVATDTIGTRETRFGGLPGVIDAEPARPDLRCGDVPVDADGSLFGWHGFVGYTDPLTRTGYYHWCREEHLRLSADTIPLTGVAT